MEIIISHDSALAYWRLHGNTNIADLVRQRRKSLQACLPNHTFIKEAATYGLSHPIDVLVGSYNARRKSEIVRSRMYTGPTPKGCFVKISDELTVCAPQFCFYQMADELPLVKLIELGFELCGTYSLAAGIRHDSTEDRSSESKDALFENSHITEHSNSDDNSYEAEDVLFEYSYESEGNPESVDKTLYGHPPLTSVKEIKAFIAHMKGVSGQKKSKRALNYIADGSASPMETILSMLLTLPQKLGGYGLPAPEMNKRIDVGSRTKTQSKKAYYICDLYWPKAKLAVEYDSDSYHTGTDRIASDSAKRLDLDALGINVITLTSRQIRNPAVFESITKLIAKKLGKRLRFTNPQFKAVNRKLRDMLL